MKDFPRVQTFSGIRKNIAITIKKGKNKSYSFHLDNILLIEGKIIFMKKFIVGSFFSTVTNANPG